MADNSTHPAECLFDLTYLEELAKGNNDFITKMLSLFIEHTPAAVKEIQVAYNEENFEQVRKLAHHIKPSIDNMGIRCLKNEIREIEANAETYKTSARLEWLITSLSKIINEVVATLPQPSTVLSA